MPWEKQFDVKDGLERAMHVFWSQGYEATSMQDLVERMGVNRSSLYATYGDKHDLFLSALRHYDAVCRTNYFAELERDYTPRRAILALFDTAVVASLGVNGQNGCFLVNTSVELSAHDGEVADIVAHGLSKTEEFFRRMIRAGQAAEEIPAHVDAAAAARGLLALMTGLRVLARSRPEKALLKSVAGQAATLLA